MMFIFLACDHVVKKMERARVMSKSLLSIKMERANKESVQLISTVLTENYPRLINGISPYEIPKEDKYLTYYCSCCKADNDFLFYTKDYEVLNARQESVDIIFSNRFLEREEKVMTDEYFHIDFVSGCCNKLCQLYVVCREVIRDAYAYYAAELWVCPLDSREQIQFDRRKIR